MDLYFNRRNEVQMGLVFVLGGEDTFEKTGLRAQDEKSWYKLKFERGKNSSRRAL